MKKNLSKEKEFYIAMTFLIAIIIFLFSNISSIPQQKNELSLSTIYHLSIFFAFTFFLTLSIKSKNLNEKTIAIAFLISLAYAISDEFHQLFVIGRFASVMDLSIDMVGSSLALLTVKILNIFKKV